MNYAHYIKLRRRFGKAAREYAYLDALTVAERAVVTAEYVVAMATLDAYIKEFTV